MERQLRTSSEWLTQGIVRGLLGAALVAAGCAPTPIKDVIAKPSQGFLASLPPMEDFGQFDSFTDALDKACDLILSKPHASVVDIPDPDLALRVADEYCAWLYYAADGKFHMSMLTNQSDADEALARKKTCRLPAFVDDPRFPPWSIKYVFALHNHPFGGPLSLSDLKQIIAFANTHEWVVETQRGRVPLAMVAFFSKTGGEHAQCDGFYQYTPETRELLKFTQTQGEWFREEMGRLTWVDEKSFLLNGNLYRSR